MKAINRLIGIIVLGLLFTTAVMADGNHEETADMNHDNDSFTGYSEYMGITGNLSIKDSIQISLSVVATDEMNEMMGDNMDQEDIGLMYQYMNRMDVKIFKIIEFLDYDQNGYSNNDTVVSEYELSNKTIGQPVLVENENKITYIASSINNSVFKITLDVGFEGGIPNSLKWSYEINYPFIQNDTSLAITHEIFSMDNDEFMDDMMNNMMRNKDMMNDNDMMGDSDMMDDMNTEMESMSEYMTGNMNGHMMNNQMMMDDHGSMPMSFSWNETAIVDGIEREVFSTEFDNDLALSFIQGENIIYDPEISVDVSSIVNADEQVAELAFSDFNNLLIIIGGVVLISSIVIILRRTK